MGACQGSKPPPPKQDALANPVVNGTVVPGKVVEGNVILDDFYAYPELQARRFGTSQESAAGCDSDGHAGYLARSCCWPDHVNLRNGDTVEHFNAPVRHTMQHQMSLHRVTLESLPSARRETAQMLLRLIRTSSFDSFGRELYSGSPGAGVNLVLHGEPDKHTGLNHYRSIVDIVGVPIELFTSRYFRVEEQVVDNPDMYQEYSRIVHNPGEDETIRCIAILPWPLDNREYVMKRQIAEIDDAGTIFSMSEDTDSLDGKYPRGAGSTTRVVKLQSSCVIQRTEAGNLRFACAYYEDSGGIIPAWIINHVATTITPRTFLSNRDDCVRIMHATQDAFGSADPLRK